MKSKKWTASLFKFLETVLSKIYIKKELMIEETQFPL